jgi:hypothetical protein
MIMLLHDYVADQMFATEKARLSRISRYAWQLIPNLVDPPVAKPAVNHPLPLQANGCVCSC